MKKQFLLLFLSLLLAGASSRPPDKRAGKDYAVFFYVTQFQPGWQTLPDTKTEAEALKNALETTYGFEGKLVPNPSRQQIFDEIAAWNNRLGPDDQVLFFFSMHGYYDPGSELGYLIAADGLHKDEYFKTWLDYNSLRPYFARCKAKHLLVALDACYSGSFGNIEKSPDRPAYDEMSDCQTQLNASFNYRVRQYICAGTKDSKTPGKSLFAAKFLETLRQGNTDADGILHFDDLTYALGKVRSPEPVHGSFAGHEPGGEFVFVRKNACESGRGTVDGNNSDLAEEQTWKIAQKLGNGKIYLDEYPNGKYAALARALKSTDVKEDNTQPAPAQIPDTRANVDPLGLVLIPGGTFQMGSNDYEADKPVHSVTVSDFYLSKYEVTVADFKAFVDATGYRTDADKVGSSWVVVVNQKEQNGVNWKYDTRGNLRPSNEYKHPVVHVSWNDAVAYCDWLSKKTGFKYRLPTEAEWEYAAGGGNLRTRWSGTSDEMKLTQHANCGGNKDGYALTAQVGSLQANAFGLYDMSGNVSEWCSDWYGAYATVHQANPSGPSSGSFRVLRSGAWNSDPQFCRVANRNFGKSDVHSFVTGFRIARTK